MINTNALATAVMPAARGASDVRAAVIGYVQHFERVAAQYADRIAVSSGDRRITYRELDRQASAYARMLEASGCLEETVVAVCCERSIELIVALLAVMKTNAAFLPLDPRFPAERMRTLMRQSGARAVVTQPAYAPTFAPSGVDVVIAECAAAGAADGAADRAQWASGRHAGDPANLAYVIYTSGSTGVPKGVGITQDSFYRYVRWANDYYRFDPDGVSVVHTSAGVDLTITSIFCPLLLGMRLVLVADDDGVDGVMRLLDSGVERIALLKLTPSHLVLMAGAGASGDVPWQCGKLIVGGEQLTAGALRFWERRCPGSLVFNEYGPTEATVGCCVALVRAGDSGGDAALPIGSPIRDAALHLGDPFAPAPLTSVPVAEGELSIGGPCLARGYLNSAAATASAFVPDTHRAGERVYRTGDWVKRGGAGLAFVGRRDRQVKINGVRVELGEVEAVLRDYPGVSAAAVAAMRESDGKDKLLAFVSLDDREIQAPEASWLIRWIRSRVVDAAVPGELYLVNKPTLAISGKTDYQALIRQRHTFTRIADRFVPPRNPAEELLASLWRSVLDVEEVGIDDSFFALDGNSMKAIQFVYGAKKRGLAITTRDLFEHQTIRQLAQLVAASPEAPAASPQSSAPSSPQPRSEPFALVDPRDRARLPEDVVDAYPLSMLQAGTILESTRRAGSATYHNVNSYHLECGLDAAEIEASLALAARRHPILRTCYDYVSYREPLQLVSRDVTIPLIVEDISYLTDEDQRRHIEAFVVTESRTAFDWTRPPLLRFFLHRRGPRRLQLTLSKHHSILDGWSAATLLAEIATNALAISRGQAPPIDGPLDTTYRDYVALERQAMQSAAMSGFWKQTLRDAPCHSLQTGSGQRRQEGEGARPITRELPFGSDLSARLNKLATRAGTPLKSVLLALHFRVLAQMIGSTDLVTGVVTHGRPETADADKAIGLFINTVPYHLGIDERQTWVELIQRVFQEERRIFPHQRYPMARIKKDVGWDRLFDSVFYYTHFHVFRPFRGSQHLRCVDSAGFEETEIPYTSAFSLHPLTGEITLRLHFAAEHFSEQQMAAIAGYFEKAVAALVAAPERPVLATSLLGDADVAEAASVRARRETSLASTPRTISELVLARARQHPDRIALIGRDRQLTYDAVRCGVERMHGVLARRGIAAGSIVGIFDTDVAHAIAAMLAVNRAGAAFAVLDPQWPDERLADVVAQLEPSLIIADRCLAGRASRLGAPIVETTGHEPEGDSAGAAVPAALAEAVAPDPDQLAYIVFTSGSSGAPKGVMISNRNLFHSTGTRIDYYQPGYERFLLLSRLTFDSSLAGIWGTLCGGGTLLVLDEEKLADAGLIAETIGERAVTHFLAIPSLYRVLLPELTSSRGGALRAVILAGEELTRDLVEAHRTQLPAVALYNEYGPSEVTVWATAADLTADGAREPAASSAPVTIGSAIAHVDAFVLDAGMRPAAAGVTGELYLGGAGVGRGYFRSPRVTATKFVPNPRASGDAAGSIVYRTGDLVRRMADGELQFLGRSDNQVKVRGFRIELEEIERAFCESFSVRDAVALVYEQSPGRKRIGLCYVTSPRVEQDAAADLDLQDVRTRLGRRLPAYSLPDDIARVESLPRLSNNKLDRKAAAALRSGLTAREQAANVEPPSTEVQRVLAEMWRETLMLPAVGVNQSFFEVGGDSLLANQVVLRTEKVFGVRIPWKAFFQTPTIAAHAAHLAGTGASLGVDFERVASVWNELSAMGDEA